MGLGTFDIILIVVYALVCIGIGWWSSRKQKHDEYLIAGRKLTTFSFAATMVATYVGGGALVGYTAYVYEYGMVAITLFIGTAIGFLIFIWYALRIRKEAKKKNFHTLSDWFLDKYNKKVAVVSALLILFIYISMLINQFIAGTSILSTVSGLSYEFALAVSASVILIYLLLGGFSSVVKTDVFQYLVLIVLFFVLGFAMLGKSVSVSQLLQVETFYVPLFLAGLIYGIFSVFVAAEYWQRVYAAKNDKVVKRGLIWSAIIVVIVGIGLSLIGLAAASYFPGIDPNQAAALGLSQLLPPALLSLGLVLLFAAIMSSADTIIFVLASSIAKDYSHNKKNQINLMKKTRLFIILVTLTGALGAYFFRDIIAMLLIAGGLGFAAAPALFGSFYWKLKSKAVIASFITGIIYVLILIFTGTLIPEIAVLSFIPATIVMLLFQFFTKHKKRSSSR